MQDDKTASLTKSRFREALGARDTGWLQRETGIPGSTLNDAVNGKMPRVDRAMRIARALGVSVEWLFGGAPRRSEIVDVDQADWITVEEYDLRQLTDESRGPGRLPTPLRRDWVAQSFGVTTGLWLARLLSDYPPADLSEGALVFCADLVPGELRDRERQLCLFRINGGLVTGRFSNLPVGAAPATGDLWVYGSQIGPEDNHYIPIARILGRFIGRL